MRYRKITGLLGSLLLIAWLSGCGDQGWVRVSPDGRYTTLIRPVQSSEDKEYLELSLYDFERDETTLITQFSPNEQLKMPFAWVMNCQWTPDSHALSFIAVYFTPPQAEDVPNSSVQESEMPEEARWSGYNLMLYELASGKLLRLPIESLAAVNWSRDGKHLIVYEDDFMISVYRAGVWTRVASVKNTTGYNDIVSWEWAVLLSDAPFSALVLLGDWGDDSQQDGSLWESRRVRQGDLYLLRGGRLIPFTTSGDVQAFWVDNTRSVVRWVCVKHKEYLAVFERPLSGGVPRRLILIPHATHPSDAQAYHTYYRFSPSGDKVAWYTEEGVYVLDIGRGTVRTVSTQQPQNTRGGIIRELAHCNTYGFDWRDNETLVLQRGDELEIVSVRRLWQ
ncbi:MAG: hypothetical protein KatS3mg017_0935 [Fimbriimonadales bacterium]|nr:MAG: hypothetical protein KatS3mg017_0418 [Fimbriimonadales bacterium]GIV07733.1 MAG: hypothetical protein KatS3mg017_0935 [Fimbriimonadales bacterium]